jgi:peroxiredoxin
MIYEFVKGEANMGKKVYTIEDKMYIVDDQTGKIKTILVQEDAPIPQKHLEELIKLLAKQASKNED